MGGEKERKGASGGAILNGKRRTYQKMPPLSPPHLALAPLKSKAESSPLEGFGLWSHNAGRVRGIFRPPSRKEEGSPFPTHILFECSTEEGKEKEAAGAKWNFHVD